MRAPFRRAGLAGDRRGAMAVEFAVTAMAFFTLVLLLLEMAWQMAVGAALDHGAREASRWAITGQGMSTGGGPVASPILVEADAVLSSREQEVLRRVVSSSGLPLRGVLGVTVRPYRSFAEAGAANLSPCAGRPPTTSVTGSAGGAGAVVRYDVSYTSAGLTPIGRSLLPSGLLLHCVVLLTTNEPFPE